MAKEEVETPWRFCRLAAQVLQKIGKAEGCHE
jgi:hypothetical protein